MPKGPRGEKRPADVIGNAIQVMRIATELPPHLTHSTDSRPRRRCSDEFVAGMAQRPPPAVAKRSRKPSGRIAQLDCRVAEMGKVSP